MTDLPKEIEITYYGSLLSICNQVLTSLKPSGNREKDEEFIFGTLCRIFAERGHKSVSFTSSPGSSKIDNLREHLFLLIDNHKESDEILECVYEFLDNVYPQDELWRLKM